MKNGRLSTALIQVLLSISLIVCVACNDDNPVANNNRVVPGPDPPAALVTETKLTVDQANFTGQCPHAFQLTGTITTNGPGIVEYQFRDDDAMWTESGSLTFNAAETKTVTMMTYSFNVDMKYYFGLELLSYPRWPIDWVEVSTACK